MAVIGSGSSGRGGAPGGGTIIIRGTWKLTQEKNGLGERTNRRTKKERKAKTSPGLGSGGIGAGTPWLGYGAGRPQESFIHRRERDQSIGDRRRPAGGTFQRDTGGGAQSLLAPGEGEKTREGEGGAGVLEGSRGLGAVLTSPPGLHPKVGSRGVGPAPRSSRAEPARGLTR